MTLYYDTPRPRFYRANKWRKKCRDTAATTQDGEIQRRNELLASHYRTECLAALYDWLREKDRRQIEREREAIRNG